MDKTTEPVQSPSPGDHRLMFPGDTITFTLTLPEKSQGRAWIRTTLGKAATVRRETIEQVADDIQPPGKAWYDIPMRPAGDGQFSATLPLTEVGHFEAKCFFTAAGKDRPVWPPGENTVINVEPADTCAANIIYNAFVRQFGPNKNGGARPDDKDKNCMHRLDERGYTVIPPSGTFRDLTRELDFIIGELGCRILQLLPIHPTPTTYGRMGRFGSPFAALNFTGVDPALAEFDPATTPLEQFTELVDAVHARQARVFLDIAVNHMGWAANLHETHPHWLVRDKNGEIQVPGAWGVQWKDLTSLDYSRKDLWQYIAGVFLTWCRRGVDGFRCDAGYKIPVPAWRYIVAVVREQFPDTVFLLEGLGGKISVTRQILDRANFNWTYSELFQNYSRDQIEHYLPQALEISAEDGNTVHFSETHDNNRLAARSKIFARMRTALCALCSHQGGFGFANGVEWLADIKIDVHEAHPLNWNAAENQIPHIRRLNRLLRTHPAFFHQSEISMIQQGAGNFLAVLRHHRPLGKKLLILVNLDDTATVEAAWPTPPDLPGPDFFDLLSEQTITVSYTENGSGCFLEPGQVFCLTPDKTELDNLSGDPPLPLLPEPIVYQKKRAVVLDILQYYHGTSDIAGFDIPTAVDRLSADPFEFCRFMNPESEESRVVCWQWPHNLKRTVMVPPGHFLLIRAPASFRIQLREDSSQTGRVLNCADSLPDDQNHFFVLLSPRRESVSGARCTLLLSLFEEDHCRHEKACLRYLPDWREISLKTGFDRRDLAKHNRWMLAVNKIGGAARANGEWGRLNSKYDALLAANLNPAFPEDRRIMFTRCRAWVVYHDFSQEIGPDCLDRFEAHPASGRWLYRVPTGQGESIELRIDINMFPGKNALSITWHRVSSGGRQDQLDDEEQVKLILRPDIDDRNFHEVTKAYTGPEHLWPEAVTGEEDAFVFAPSPDRRLHLRMPGSRYVNEPEWHYMICFPTEADRGLEASSDLFSPGYFSSFLKGGQTAVLFAAVNEEDFMKETAPSPADGERQNDRSAAEVSAENLKQRLTEHLRAYLVKRGDLLSVIAGYPWFLDWGRDSLIVARGMIAAGMTAEAASVLKQFGRLEAGGTLPNMISGKDASNRDTVDAPLWFFAACRDMIKANRNGDFLDEVCDGRRIRDILLSIGRGYVSGTPSGIHMDPDSGLIFSPAHYTWMDTDHPAGTPRQGYCIEIQALWQAALTLLSDIDPRREGYWHSLEQTVKQSIHDLFPTKESFLADCLHAEPGQPAGQAIADDHLRPNQLFALTLGALEEPVLERSILETCQQLLVPGAIRSLADRPVSHPLPVTHHGSPLNDPHHPYQGRYQGDEDTRRKPAYHNGTAWTWLFPVFCEAWAIVFGEAGKAAARAWLTAGLDLMETGCVGHLPEIMDGDYPHTQRGCDAQAWGLSEWLRVWGFLHS